MTTTQPDTVMTNPGIERALNALVDDATTGMFSASTDWALAYLHTLITPHSGAHEVLNTLSQWIRTVRIEEKPLDDRGLTRSFANELLDVLTEYPIELAVIVNPAELAAFRAEHGLRTDWHEPCNQSISARVTPGEFDNASGAPSHLEQSVIYLSTKMRDVPEPIAAVNLANLCAWASGPRE